MHVVCRKKTDETFCTISPINHKSKVRSGLQNSTTSKISVPVGHTYIHTWQHASGSSATATTAELGRQHQTRPDHRLFQRDTHSTTPHTYIHTYNTCSATYTLTCTSKPHHLLLYRGNLTFLPTNLHAHLATLTYNTYIIKLYILPYLQTTDCNPCY